MGHSFPFKKKELFKEGIVAHSVRLATIPLIFERIKYCGDPLES